VFSPSRFLSRRARFTTSFRAAAEASARPQTVGEVSVPRGTFGRFYEMAKESGKGAHSLASAAAGWLVGWLVGSVVGPFSGNNSAVPCKKGANAQSKEGISAEAAEVGEGLEGKLIFTSTHSLANIGQG